MNDVYMHATVTIVMANAESCSQGIMKQRTLSAEVAWPRPPSGPRHVHRRALEEPTGPWAGMGRPVREEHGARPQSRRALVELGCQQKKNIPVSVYFPVSQGGLSREYHAATRYE